ncbi:hypothetical protein BpHYR1_033691 [Brachionus plicatilis]|uniref:Uncharacterized protein n=1 Tax=Brachionus plicatilis TaxID=10195 RepID=A0A3M7PW21_BRAPC|nr:hypothetical protein BpHYR1_033691 [Brachionus plicatilis]
MHAIKKCHYFREISLEFILTNLKFYFDKKKILLKSESKSPLTLINCIFAYIGSDLKSSLDSLFTQLLNGLVQHWN